MGGRNKGKKPASTEQMTKLEGTLLASIDSFYKELNMDHVLYDVVSKDANEYCSHLVNVHSNVCYSLLCLCVLLRAELKAELPVEKKYLLRRIVVLTSELYKYLYTFTEGKTEWKTLTKALAEEYPKEIEEINKQANIYKKKYGRSEDKTIRDVSKHYSSNPLEFFNYVSKIEERSIVDRGLQLLRYSQPLSLLIVTELKKQLKLGYDLASVLVEPKVDDVVIRKLDSDFLEKTNGFVSGLNKTTVCLCQTIHKAEKLVQDYGVDITQDRRWRLFADDNIVLHVLYLNLDVITLIRAFVRSENAVEKRQILAYLKISIHEGLKKLYGYTDKDREKSLWNRFVERSKSGIDDKELIKKIESCGFMLQVMSDIPQLKDEKTVSFLSHVGYVKELDQESSQAVLKHFSTEYEQKELGVYVMLVTEMNDIYGIAQGIIGNEKRLYDEESEKKMNKYLSEVDAKEKELLGRAKDKRTKEVIKEQAEGFRELVRMVYRY